MTEVLFHVPTGPFSQDLSEAHDGPKYLRYEPVSDIGRPIGLMLSLLNRACRHGDTVSAGEIVVELHRMNAPLTARAHQEVGGE